MNRKFTAKPGKGIVASTVLAASRKSQAYKSLLIEFGEARAKQIQKGLESGLDVSWYADRKFNDWQMWQIRKGLESGVDVSVYADPKYRWEEMNEIREGLESGVDVSIYADPKFDEYQMHQIRLGLESGVDVSQYADPKFDWEQMEKIREGRENTTEDLLLNQTPAEGSDVQDVFEFVDRNVDTIVDEVNDEDWRQELWGDSFRAECRGKMIDLLYDNGYSLDIDGVDDYIDKVFEKYGE